MAAVNGIGNRYKFVHSLARSLLSRQARTSRMPTSDAGRFLSVPMGMQVKCSHNESDFEILWFKDVDGLSWDMFRVNIMDSFCIKPDFDIYHKDGTQLNEKWFEDAKSSQKGCDFWNELELEVVLVHRECASEECNDDIANTKELYKSLKMSRKNPMMKNAMEHISLIRGLMEHIITFEHMNEVDKTNAKFSYEIEDTSAKSMCVTFEYEFTSKDCHEIQKFTYNLSEESATCIGQQRQRF